MDEMDTIIKQIAEKAKSFLEDILRKINASDILTALISRHIKEEMYLLVQSLDTNPSIRDILGFIQLFDDEFTIVVNEYLACKTDNRLLEKKVD